MTLRKYLLFICLALFPLQTFGQSRHIELRHISTADGLSENTVYCIEQDQHGFMWFGTQTGLNQYDGYRFKIFQNNSLDSTSISDDYINALLEDQDGTLWIGTNSGGLNCFNRLKNSFDAFQNDPQDSTSLPSNSVQSLFVDMHDQFWIGTASGLSRLQPESNSFITILPGYSISTLYEDAQSNLWIGTSVQGLFKLDANRNLIEHFVYDPANLDGLGSNEIRGIAEDAEHNLWVATIDGGLNLYRKDSDSFLTFKHNPGDPLSIKNNTLFTLFLDQNQDLLAGLENGGIQTVKLNHSYPSKKDAEFRPYVKEGLFTSTFNQSTVRSIYEDRQGNLWIGTYNNGIELVSRDRKQFVNYYNEPYHEEGLNNNIIQTFLEDENGKIWIGTDGGGLNYFDPDNDSFVPIMHDPLNPTSLSNNHILDICKEHAGDLWIATWDGLNRMDPDKRSFISFHHREGDPSTLSSSKVTCVHEDLLHNLWIGTLSGLNLYNRENGIFSRPIQSNISNLAIQYIQSIKSDKKGNVWIATVWGLHLIRNEDLRKANYTSTVFLNDADDPSSISENQVLSIHEDRNGLIWCGTLNGLNCYDPNTEGFTSYSMQDGFTSNWISSIVEDDAGILWLGTHKGLTRFDPQTGSSLHFDTRDGLIAEDFTRGVLRSNTGELYFGGKTGFTRFFPDYIRQSTFIPPVVLTDFRIFTQSIPLEEVLSHTTTSDSSIYMCIDLSYKRNNFSFEFASLDLTAPEKNRYRYQLEGFDPTWREVDASRRFATYTNLSGGEYTFRVKGSNSDGLWNETPLTIALKIHPPFFKTKWATLLYFIASIILFLILRQLIIYRQKLKNEIEFEKVEAERIHELDAMKLRFFTNISHEFRTPLTLIIGLLQKLIQSPRSISRDSRHQNYQIISRNANRLLRLINQIMDIRKLDEGCMQLELKHRDIVQFIRAITSSFKFQAEQRHIHFGFKTEQEELFAWFDPDKVDKIIYNVLSNAFKFTHDGGHIQIQLKIKHASDMDDKSDQKETDQSTKPNRLEIQIEDDGIGIPEDYVEKIFNPFVQAQNERSSVTSGTGIGLALTRELVEMHEGSVSVTSQPSQGSVFMIVLPLDLRSSIPDESDEQVESTQQYETVGTKEFAEISADPEIACDAPTVLLVDDELDFRRFLIDELCSEYHFLEAGDGETAYQMTMSEHPDLIVSDVRMPKMDGFTLCSTLKQNPDTSHIPIILLTSQTDEKSRIDGFDHGADDYIAKPFDVNLLRIRIANLMDSRKMLKDLYSHEIYLQPNNIVITPDDERFLKRVLECIEDQMENSDFNVTHLGRGIGLSRVQLYRKVKALTDLTPNDLIKTLRMKRAAQLLEESQLTVFEIAYQVGFKDPSYFSKCFRHQFSTSPAVYAHAHIQKPRPESSTEIDIG